MLLEEFVNNRNIINGVADDLVPLLAEVGLQADLAEVHSQMEKLKECRFNVLVMGQLKRGKSTLVNVLLRKPGMLPSGVIPVSSTVVSIGHGDSEEAKVNFKDGHSETGPIEVIKQYCVEKNNPKNEKSVSGIEVRIPHPWLEDGIHIVDTPGAGSVESYHTEISYQHIPEADVILFLLSADMPIGDGERKFLVEIAKYGARKVIFVLNKADRLEPHEVAEVLEYNLDIIRQEDAFKEVEKDDFYLVSASLAMGDLENGMGPQLDSGFPRLEARMVKLLTEERTTIAIGQTASGLIGTVSRLRQTLQLEQETSRESLSEIESRISACKEQVRKFEEERAKNAEDIRYNADRTKRQLNLDVPKLRKSINSAWESKLQQTDILKRLVSPAALCSELEVIVVEAVTEQVGEAVEDAFKKFLKPKIEEIERQIESELDDLREFEGKFGVDQYEVNFLYASTVIGGLSGAGLAAGGGIWSVMLGSQGLLASLSTGIFGASTAATVGAVFAPILIATGPLVILVVAIRQYAHNQDKIKSALKESVDAMLYKCTNRINEDLDSIRERAVELFNRIGRLRFEPMEQALRMAQEEKNGIDQGAQERRARYLAQCESMESTLRGFLILGARTPRVSDEY